MPLMTIEAEFHGKWRKQLVAKGVRFQAVIDNGGSETFVTKHQTLRISCGSDEEGGEIEIQDGRIEYGEKPRAEAFVLPLSTFIAVRPNSTNHIAYTTGESLLTIRHFPNRFRENREDSRQTS